MNSSAMIRALKNCFPYICLLLISGLLTHILLRNVANLDHPLNGEFFTSPFLGDVLGRYWTVWDEHFGLGVSNVLNSQGGAPHEGEFSGAYNIASDSVSYAFQALGYSYFLNQSVSLFILALGIYWIFRYFRFFHQSTLVSIFVSFSVAVIIQSSDMIMSSSASGGRFLAGQGLMLIAFLQIRRLLQFPICATSSVDQFLPLLVSLATLLLVFNQFFLSLALLIGIQGVIEYISRNNRKEILVVYAKLLTIFICLIVVIFGHVILPALLSSSPLMSGGVGRHDSPLAQQFYTLLRFYNDPVHDKFGTLGIWLQSGLTLIGVIWAVFSPIMRRWVAIDLILVGIFLVLAKGSAPPFPEINHWLHVNIPFLRIMGSSYPYNGAVYTLMIYYLIFGVGSLLTAIVGSLPRRIGVIAGSGILVGIVVLAIFRNDDYLSGDLGGRVESIEYPAEYYEFKNIAERDMQVGRAYYFPDEGAQISSDYQYSPPHSMGCCFDLPFSSTFPVNVNWSNFNKVSGYYGRTMNYLMHHPQSGNEIAHIFSEADTRFAVFDLSVKPDSSARERMLAIREQVLTSSSFEYKPALSNKYLEVYENKQWKPYPRKVKSVTLATENPSVFREASRQHIKLTDDAIVVSGQLSLKEASELKSNKVLKRALLYNSDIDGLMLDLIHAQYEIKPDANELSNNGLAWFSYNDTYKSEHIQKKGGAFLGRYSVASVSEGSNITFETKVESAGSRKIYIRAIVSPSAGRVMVTINGEKRLLDLHSNGYVGPQWFDMGSSSDQFSKHKITIESLDSGKPKIIDLLILVPEKELKNISEEMSKLVTGLEVIQVEKPNYLRWKKSYVSSKPSNPILPEEREVRQRTIVVNRSYFKIHDDFDDFQEINNSLNVSEYLADSDSVLDNSTREKRFQRSYNGIQYEYVGSGDAGSGTYALNYRLLSCEAFSELSLGLNTAYLSEASPLMIKVSADALSWVNVAKLTSDDQSIKKIDLSDFVKGKKQMYLKISYDKKSEEPGSIYLLNTTIKGRVGKENMHCATPIMDVKAALHWRQSKSESSISSSNLSNDQDINVNEGRSMKYLIVDSGAFDSNRLLNGVRPIQVNYGMSAYLIPEKEPVLSPIHTWENVYRVLWGVAFGFYFFLWLALIQSRCREKAAVMRD